MALARNDPKNAANAAAALLTRADDEAVITDVFTAFLQRQRGPESLASALSGSGLSEKAAEIGLRVMNASGRREENLARALSKTATLNSQMTAQEISSFAKEVREKGDAKRGAEVYQRPALGCIACHAVEGQGGSIGPNLSAVGSAQPIDFIIGAILEPQKEVKEGYTSISVTSKDGEEYQGYQVRETKDELVLRDVLQNKEVRLQRGTIQEKRQNGSVMPTGLTDTLNRDEFRDLVRYLSELGRTK